MLKIARGNNLKELANLLIIFYQLTKSKLLAVNNGDILITKNLIINTSFQCRNLQRAITRNNNFYKKNHQVIYSSSSISFKMQ